MSLRTELESLATDVEDALAVPTGNTDAECRGYDQACRDTLTRLRQILAADDEGRALVQAIHDRKATDAPK